MHDELQDDETIAALPDSGITDAAKTLLASGGVQAPRAPGQFGTVDRFEVVRCVGSGGMGVVLLARDPMASRQVAIKMLRAELSDHPEAVHRFLTEARHMAKFSHRNILPVLEVCDRPTGPYYVMPWIEGGSVARRIRPGEHRPDDEIVTIGIGVAEALDHAHRHGIIHRDLKPANVLLDKSGAAVLCDFGLVRTVFNDSFVDVEGSHCEGTAAYMSPAVAAGEAEDTRCDIYSFGAMLYEMLTGCPPYSGRSTRDILRQIQAGPPAPIPTLNPKAPEALVRVVEGAMARDLGQRYASMNHVLADLRRVREGKRPLGPEAARGAMDWLRGFRGRRAVIAAVVSLLVVLSVLWVWHYTKSRGPERQASVQSTVPPAPALAAAAGIPPTGRDYIIPDLKMEFVWLSPLKLWVGKCEVTNGEYRGFSPDHDSGEYGGHSLNGDSQPVANVSFDDAVAYTKWLTERERQAGRLSAGRSYRLPTGDEWIRFARCGESSDTRTYPWGDKLPPKYGNYDEKALPGHRDPFPVSCPVQNSGSNEWNLYGVGGNVCELTSKDPHGLIDGTRGGSWDGDREEGIRCVSRGNPPEDARYPFMGFRLVLAGDAQPGLGQ